MRPAKTQISLGIRPVWSESSLSTWRKLGSLATHWAHSEDSDQTGWMPRLIWVFDGRTLTLLVLSRGSSFYRKKSLGVLNLSMNIKGLAQTAPGGFTVHSVTSICLFLFSPHLFYIPKLWDNSYEPRHEKTCLRDFRPCKSQTGLLSYRDYLGL